MSCRVLTDKEVTVRKPHRCIMCRRKFPEGSRMHYQSNIYKGDFGSVYWCMTCEGLSKMASTDFSDGEFSYPEGCVDESLEKGQTPEMLLMDLKEKECLNLERTKSNLLK